MALRINVMAHLPHREISSPMPSVYISLRLQIQLSIVTSHPVKLYLTSLTKRVYITAESTIYRVLHANKMMKHRSAARPRKHKKPDELSATRPNQLWSWDITYLTSDIRGKYFYLYLFLDIFSRNIVGFDVFDEQSAEHAADVVSAAYMTENVRPSEVTLHADNGGPMKGSMMLAILQNLGVTPSFSRPSVSNDNPHSESMSRTLKYCPQYPDTPFKSTELALDWVRKFVDWYNNIHQHPKFPRN